jgi:serine/threonine protein phosphatase PrpC
MRIRPDVELANLTDLGIQREQNEDYFLYIEPEDDDEFARKGRLLLVADGMGGHKGGEVASGIAAAALREALRMRKTRGRSWFAAFLRRSVRSCRVATRRTLLQAWEQPAPR